MFDQIAGYCGLAKLTHTINHHTLWGMWLNYSNVKVGKLRLRKFKLPIQNTDRKMLNLWF